MSHELYKKVIKEDLKKAIESGALNEEQCISVIDTTLRDLLTMDDPNINKAIDDFRTKIETETKELTRISQNISKEYKEMYEDILKDM